VPLGISVHCSCTTKLMKHVKLTFLCQQKSEGAEPQEDYLSKIEAAKKLEGKGTEFKYEERDVMLYNLGVGAKKTDLPLVL